MKKFCFLIILAIIFLSLPAVAKNSQKIEIMVLVANVRATPGLEGKIVGKAYLGDQFSVINEEGSWFKIIFKPNEDGEKKFGYVYKTITKVITGKKISSTPPPEKEKAKTEKEKAKKEKKIIEDEQKKVKKERKKAEKEKKKAEKKKLKAEKKAEKEKLKSLSKEEKEKIKAEKKVAKEKERAIKKAEREKKRTERKAEREKKKTAPKKVKMKGTVDYLFKGFYLKGGWMTKPKVDSFGDKWVLDLGFDTPIGKYLTWGLEFQPYFRSYSADFIDISVYNLTSNVFINVKGGINLGVLWDKIDFVTVFLGGGPGVSLSYLYTDYEGVSSSLFDVYFAWHIVYGMEFTLGKMNVVVEFQSNKVINPDIDPSTQSSSLFLLGIRF